MFQNSINRIKNWFCENTNFKELPHPAFDDRHIDSGYFIKEGSGQTEFVSSSTNAYAIGTRRYEIYLQFRNDITFNIVSGLLSIFLCNGEEVVSVDTSSKDIYETIQNNKFTNNGFHFAKISVDLKDTLRPNHCKVC